MNHPARLLLACALSALAAPVANAGTDVLRIDSGDRLTGEVKSLDRGMLTFDTDAIDTVQVHWSHVTGLTSSQNFQVALSDGRQLLGTLSPGENAEQLRLETGGGPLELPIVSIVRLTPIEGRVLGNVKMKVDLGYSVAKANDVAQTTFGYDFGYRNARRLLSLNLDASRSASQDAAASTRANATFTYRQFHEDRQWDPIGLAEVERNDELGLDRRVTLGGGMSHWIKDTNSNRMSFTGGLVYTRENETAALEGKGATEAAIGLNLEWFRYDEPKLDVSTRFTVYERLSDTHRTRGNLDVDLRWELVSSLFWGFSVYYSFNNATLGQTASSNDYGLVTSLGWSF